MIHTVEELLNMLHKLPRKNNILLVGIDGCGGSGKSSLARKLRDISNEVVLIEMDDFYRPSSERTVNPESNSVGADFDWMRVREQVLLPLCSGKEGNFQRYDWDNDRLAEWHEVPINGIVIIEGVYSTRKELSEFYDFKIWVDSPYNVRLERGLARDGEAARARWENEWMPAEDRYVNEHRSYELADIVIDGSGIQASLDENKLFVVKSKFL
ncbi:uridine kinase family protein [Paenibacillus taiwanensis]|uniref:uridine kinase family protein n=1 Tax=Paenibacillus taiwanensis TaxID=401638 RepID=UPI0004022ED8|nr:uridine kinase [Paenibacillus taiwanensis]